MFSRSTEHNGVTFEARFVFSPGDPDVNIHPGWEPEVTIKAGALTVSIDFEIDLATDPGEWTVNEIDASYKCDDHLIELANRDSAKGIPWRVLRLSELPEVLEVVRQAWSAEMASERLQGAQENLSLAQEARDALLWEITEEREPKPADKLVMRDLEREILQTKVELGLAQAEAIDVGILTYDQPLPPPQSYHQQLHQQFVEENA